MNVYISNNSTVSMTGGSVTDNMYLLDTSKFNILNGNVQYLIAEYSSTANILGGTLKDVAAIEDATATLNLRGGNITYWLYVGRFSTVNVFGYDLVKNNIGGKYNFGYITGFWQDGTPFNIDLRGSDTYSRVNLIPEPATITLLLISGVFILRRRR